MLELESFEKLEPLSHPISQLNYDNNYVVPNTVSKCYCEVVVKYIRLSILLVFHLVPLLFYRRY